MVPWTNSVPHAARHIYESIGSQLVKQGKLHALGKNVVEQTWELVL
jgi:hypothetical protein